MPQFYVGERKMARVTFANPKGVALGYTASLYIGSTQVAEVPFTLNAGEQRELAFSVTMPPILGTYPVLLYVYSSGQCINIYRATEDVAITGLILKFSNPKKSTTIAWDALISDISSGVAVNVPCEPSGAQAISVAKQFRMSCTSFLLEIQEITPSGAYYYGPYLVNLPSLGEYTWNSKAETVGGYTVQDVTKLQNRSFITAVAQFVYQEDPWSNIISLQPLEAASDVVGYANVAKWYVGRNIISRGEVPNRGGPMYEVPPRQRVTGYLDLRKDHSGTAVWYGWNWHAYPEYPPEAYQFTCSKQFLDPIYQESDYGPVLVAYGRMQYTVTGNVSPFKMVIVDYDPVTGNKYSYRLRTVYGPGSGEVGPVWLNVRVFCHPNPNAAWDWDFWDFYNWKQV